MANGLRNPFSGYETPTESDRINANLQRRQAFSNWITGIGNAVAPIANPMGWNNYELDTSAIGSAARSAAQSTNEALRSAGLRNANPLELVGPPSTGVPQSIAEALRRSQQERAMRQAPPPVMSPPVATQPQPGISSMAAQAVSGVPAAAQAAGAPATPAIDQPLQIRTGPYGGPPLNLTGGTPTFENVGTAPPTPGQVPGQSFLNVPDRTPEQRLGDMAGRFGTVIGPGAQWESLQGGPRSVAANSILVESQRDAANRAARLQEAQMQAGVQREVAGVRNQLSPADRATMYTAIRSEIRGAPGNERMSEAALNQATNAELNRRITASSGEQPAPPGGAAQAPSSFQDLVIRAQGNTPQARLADIMRGRQNRPFEPQEMSQLVQALQQHFGPEYNQQVQGSAWEAMNNPLRAWPWAAATPDMDALSALRNAEMTAGRPIYGAVPGGSSSQTWQRLLGR
jgi:hypothetical protein